MTNQYTSAQNNQRDPMKPAPTIRILIVDDEPSESAISQEALQRVAGYEVRVERFPLKALQVARSWKPDIIILDVTMPDLNGIILGKLLKADGCPADLMYVTAVEEMETKEQGLEVADQYLTKPFESRELLARVRVLVRKRQQLVNHDAAERDQNELRPIFDHASNTVRAPGGRTAKLTPTEKKLLLALLAANGKPVHRVKLLKDVWNVDEGDALSDKDLVQVNISRLRKKIEKSPREPELILTMQGGYCYRLTR